MFAGKAVSLRLEHLKAWFNRLGAGLKPQT